MDFDDILVNYILPFLIVVMVIFIAIGMPLAIYSSNACSLLGYPEGSVNTSGFICMRTVNQTQYICTLNDARKGTCNIPQPR